MKRIIKNSKDKVNAGIDGWDNRTGVIKRIDKYLYDNPEAIPPKGYIQPGSRAYDDAVSRYGDYVTTPFGNISTDDLMQYARDNKLLIDEDDIEASEAVDDIEREFQRIDRSGTDEEVAIAAIMYNLGTTMREAREILPTLSEDKIKDYVDYYHLRDLPRSKRIEIWNNRKNISSSSNVKASNDYINSAYEYFDKVYGKCISEANQDINTIRRMYANNEGAPSTILLNLGYTEDESGEAFTKSMHTAGHIYETVFDFAKYDWEDGPVLMYVLRDGEVPKGWTVTKFDLYDEEGNVISSAIDPYSEEDDPAEFNSVEDYLKYNIEEGYIDWLSLPSEENDDFDDDDFDDDDFYDIVYQIESAIAKVTRGGGYKICVPNQFEDENGAFCAVIANGKRYAVEGRGNTWILSESAESVESCSNFNEYEDDIQEISQEFTSENTSINSTKLPAIFKMVSFEPGTTNIDYGGGRFDNVADYLTKYDVINLVYDPYNRTPQHNKEVIKTLRRAGGADTATCSNVLNVIKEPEVRKNVLENISKIVKPGGKVYITVYEGSGKGDEGPTKAGYQLNRKTADYLDEIREVFPDANRKGKLIVATNSRTVNSSTNIKASSTEGYVYTYCDECGKKNRVKVTFNNFNEPFNDTEYKCEYCGTRNMLTDPHEYDENGYVVEASQSYLDRIEELMNQGLDEETASREAYAEFYPDEYDVDDYDEIYSANYGGTYYVEVNSTRRGTAPYEKKFSDFNSALSFAKKRGNSKTIIYIWDIPKEERSSNSVPNAVYDFDSGWQIIRPVNVNEDRSVNKTITSANYGGAYDVDPEQYFTREDLVEFADDVVDRLNAISYSKFDYTEVYLEPGNNLELTIAWSDYEDTIKEHIDMRKIRKPSDLCKVYAPLFVNRAKEVFSEYGADFGPHYEEDEIYSSKQSNSKLNQIRDKITKVVKKVMMSAEFGFPEDEVEEYSVVEVDPSGKVEVRAEVSYDGLMTLCDALNPIVQRYDKDSYFEPVQPGIIQAWIENKNGVVESSKSPNSVANKYPEYMKVSRGGQDFSVHYNLIDNSPSADAHQMWLEFQATVSAIKPYDDAEYAWAQIENGHINVIKGGKVIQQYYYFDADDMDVENYEWCQAIVEQAIDYISEINDKVESRIIHNSTDTKGETIEAGYYDVPERPLDPPEYDDPVEEDPIQEICEFSFDAVVILDKDGGWDYENNDYSFAANPDDKHGDWYTYEDHIYLTDQTGMVEDLDDLIEPMMPAGPGKYRIQGDATMVFDVDNLYAYYDYYRDGSYDKELLKDDAEVTFNYQESKVENFKFIELN